MGEIHKHPQVIQDLIEIATYIAESDLDRSDSFLRSVEETFKQLGKMPEIGKKSYFSNPRLQNIRQLAVKGFGKYLIFYQTTKVGVQIIRVLHGSREIETTLEDNSQEEM